MPDTIVTKAIAQHFAEWAVSLSPEEQATLAEWMGVTDQENVRRGLETAKAERSQAHHEDVARRLIGKVRRFSEVELDADERRLLNMLLTPGLAHVLGTGPASPSSDAEGEVLPRGLSAVLPAAISVAMRDERVRVVGLTSEGEGHQNMR